MHDKAQDGRPNMNAWKRGFGKQARLGILLLGMAGGLFGRPGAAADDETKSAGKANPSVEDYKIGPNDVITLSVTDAPEFGGKFRVSESGSIEVPGVPGPIQAEGQTTTQLARAVRQALIDAKQLRDPQISVFMSEYHGRTITVLGAVNKPAEYPLEKRTTVLAALSLAGGALPNSGNTVTIVRGPASAEATGTPVGSVEILEMSNLLSGATPSANVEVKNGDVISVSAAKLIYVVGAVVKPGGFTMSDPASGVSAIQALALAEGLKSIASRNALIVRQSTSDHGRTEIPVNLAQMMAGKATDVVLAPNDILFVPTSGTRQTLKVLGDVAMATVNGIAIYGIGYRIGNVK
jgi:polysaccharide export outer membrane protein